MSNEIVKISLETIAGLAGEMNAALEEAAEHLVRHADLDKPRKVTVSIALVPDKKQDGVYGVEFEVDAKVPSSRHGSGIALRTRAGFVGMMAPMEQTDIEKLVEDNVVAMKEAAAGI